MSKSVTESFADLDVSCVTYMSFMFNFADAANDYQAFLEDERDRKLEAERLKKTSSTKSDTLSESKDDGSLTREF